LGTHKSKGEGKSFQEGGLYFISHQNVSKLGTHLLIDANETELQKNPKFLRACLMDRAKN
jgi:hypothetical protein